MSPIEQTKLLKLDVMKMRARAKGRGVAIYNAQEEFTARTEMQRNHNNAVLREVCDQSASMHSISVSLGLLLLRKEQP